MVRGGDRLGLFYLEAGVAQRPSKVVYDRAGTAIRTPAGGDYDWPAIFADADWFHFSGTAAALVFPRLFFPEFSPFVGQILAFLTHLVGFLARPLGGLLFGYLGDRVGRKSTLVATLLLMGVSTITR